MDGAEGLYQRLMGSLQTAFRTRIPSGLTPAAESRLGRTVRHYMQEVSRVNGRMDEQEVLRESFDSMAAWFRRNTDQLKAFTPQSQPMMSAPLPPDPIDTDDPIALFERIRAMRASETFPAPAPAPASLAPPPPYPSAPELTTLPQMLPQPLSLPHPRTPVQPKDTLIRQENVVKYREQEYNLVLSSKDRDWHHNRRENRYNFSVVLDSAARPQGTGPQLTLQNRFRNIVRLEFVKAILPVEGLDVIIARDCPGAAPAPEKSFYSALALPYINVIMDEIQGNNYGTNDTTDKSLAVCQYDATWRSDFPHGGAAESRNVSRGYTLFFPKFMKAQRIYAPTPLASLQRMSFRLVGPENNVLSKTPDSSYVRRIAFSSLPDISGSCYGDASGSYLFVETKEWFSLWAYSRLDRVAFAGLTFSDTSPERQRAGRELLEWLQSECGHVVVGIAHTDASGAVIDGPNDCGYANWIVLRNRHRDPTTGDCALEYFTAGGSATEAELADALAAFPADYQDGGVLNLSRQVQLVLRIITREMDSTTNVRPDNV